jgi:hypothetical protein
MGGTTIRPLIEEERWPVLKARAFSSADEAFGKFFARLAAAGIDKSNTLFVFTVEEGDHCVGAKPRRRTATASTSGRSGAHRAVARV